MPVASLSKSFIAQSECLAQLLEGEGIAVRPFASTKVPYFMAMEEVAQRDVVANLTSYVEVGKKVISEGGSLKNRERFVLAALDYYNLTAHPDFLKDLANDPGIVEFYSMQGTQFFRTFNFFEYSSYTIEDIYCRQWVHLYERPKEVIERMYELVSALYEKGSLTETCLFEQPHVLRERVSLERLSMSFRSIFISPLSQENKMKGLSTIVKLAP